MITLKFKSKKLAVIVTILTNLIQTFILASLLLGSIGLYHYTIKGQTEILAEFHQELFPEVHNIDKQNEETNDVIKHAGIGNFYAGLIWVLLLFFPIITLGILIYIIPKYLFKLPHLIRVQGPKLNKRKQIIKSDYGHLTSSIK